MKSEYDTHYQTENLFGKPYPELIDFYSKIKNKGRLLDVGCGQGRDAISLAKLGFIVTGIDNSKVGIDQLNKIAEKENLPLIGIVKDIYSYSSFDQFEHILLDSMFHFGKKEIKKEVDFLSRLITESKTNTFITICIQNTGEKLEILNSIFSKIENIEIIKQEKLIYKFEDKKSNHSSATKYEMIVIKKV